MLIESKDIVEKDPLRIESLGECEILDAKVIKEINTLNKFRINFVNSKSIIILFDFLDKGQGGAIQVKELLMLKLMVMSKVQANLNLVTLGTKCSNS